MDEKLCGTSITGLHIATCLSKAFGPKAILKSLEAVKIGVDQGFISDVLKLKLTWDTEDVTLPTSVIVKIPSAAYLEGFLKDMSAGQKTGEAGTTNDSALKWIPFAHNQECKFYHIFEKEPLPIKMPKCYAAVPFGDKDPAMIILEDFSETAGVASSLLDGLTYLQASAAVTEIARLHAWSLTTSIDWRSIVPALEEVSELMNGFLAPVMPAFERALEKFPNLVGPVDMAKLRKLMTWESFESIMAETRKFMPDILGHYDYHRNNILYHKRSDGSIGNKLAAVIDFQSVMKSSPANDLVRLLCFSITPEIRREHTQDILRQYYDTVTSIAGDKFTMSFGQLEYHYNRLLGLEAVFSVAWAPVMMKKKCVGEADEKRYLHRVKALWDDAIGYIMD